MGLLPLKTGALPPEIKRLEYLQNCNIRLFKNRLISKGNRQNLRIIK